MIKGTEVVNGLRQEGVTFFGEDKVIGNTDRDSFWENDGVYQEWVERAQTTNVKVEVDTSVMVQNKVTNGVGALDDVFVVVEGVKKPRVVLGDEFARIGICPQHVFAEGRIRQGACRTRERRTSRTSCHDSPWICFSTLEEGFPTSRSDGGCGECARPFRGGMRSSGLSCGGRERRGRRDMLRH